MVPGKYDITIYRGKTWSISLEAQNAQEVALNFAEAYSTMRLQIRPPWKLESTPTRQPLFELTNSNGRITTQNDGTSLVLTISAADTAKLAFSAGKYELELVTDDEVPVVDSLLYGSVTVTDEITV
jgi:hypothetical protein